MYQVATASGVLKELNESWEALYETPFTEILRKIPKAKLTPRKNKLQKQKHLRNIHRKCKKRLEAIWQNENRDVETLYGTRQSGSAHTKQRASLFFEAKEQAVKRKGKQNRIHIDMILTSFFFQTHSSKIYYNKFYYIVLNSQQN